MKNIYLIQRGSFLCGFIFLIASIALGEENKTNLLEKPLEELLEIRITTTSKQSEKISDSPGIVTVVTQNEIETYGARNLNEILDRVVGVYAMGTTDEFSGIIAMRGDITRAVPSANHHILLLLNGRPIRDSLQGGATADVFSAFPIDSIQQLEVIRGPGSVLYGTNAFTGVINIITKDGSQDGAKVGYSYGSYQTHQFHGVGEKKWGDLKLSVGVTSTHTDGWNYSANGYDPTLNQTIPGSMNAYNNNIGANFGAKYKFLTLTSFLDTGKSPHMAFFPIVPTWSAGGPGEHNRALVDLGSDYTFSKYFRNATNFTYNHMAVTEGVVNSPYDVASNDYLFESTQFLTPLENWNITLGGSYQNGHGSVIDSTLFQSVAPYSVQSWNLYAQTDYKLFNKLKLIAGGQLNQAPGANKNFVPRLGSVLQITPSLGMKLLYSKAFRASSENERKLKALVPPNTLLKIGNPDLQPETIGTTDFQIFYESASFYAAATLYYSTQGEIIDQVQGTYTNSGGVSSKGIELESHVKPIQDLQLNGSLAYQKNENDIGQEDINHLPNLMIKGGASYHSSYGLTFSLFDSFFGSITPVDSIGGASTHDVNPAVHSYHFLSANLLLDMKRLLKLQTFPRFTAELYMTNILNESIYYPEFYGRIINSIPGRSGRSVYAGLSVAF